MKQEQIEKAAVTMKESQNYHMSFEDAQDYINKCGFDIPWNDGNVFVDEREITRTIGNVLKWRINSVWHDASEKPDKNQLVVFECRKTYGKGYSVNFGENYELMKNVIVRWAYIIDLLPERKEETE